MSSAGRSHATDASPLAWLDTVAAQRRQSGLRRVLRSRPADSAAVDLASNDYLGLARHPEVIDGAVRALRTWGEIGRAHV